MLVNIAYMLMGIAIGFMIKYEIDIKSKKKHLKKRIAYSKTIASSSTIQQYDEILKSIKSVNEGLSSIQKQKQQREVQ